MTTIKVSSESSTCCPLDRQTGGRGPGALLNCLLLVLPQMSSRCRNALKVLVTSLFAAAVLLTILLAYVTGSGSNPGGCVKAACTCS